MMKVFLSLILTAWCINSFASELNIKEGFNNPEWGSTLLAAKNNKNKNKKNKNKKNKKNSKPKTEETLHKVGFSAVGQINNGSVSISWSEPNSWFSNLQNVNEGQFTLRQKLPGGVWENIYSGRQTEFNINSLSEQINKPVQYDIKFCPKDLACTAWLVENTDKSNWGNIKWLDTLSEADVVTTETEMVGELDYDVAVQGAGKGIVTVPIKIPPGVNNLIPTLNLRFDSSLYAADNSHSASANILPAGWILSGISSIHTCRMNYQNNKNPLIENTTLELAYCLNGNTLIGTNAGVEYDSNGKHYRLYKDNFTRIEKIDGYFKVYYPNGSVAVFGQHRNSRHIPVGKNTGNKLKDDEYNLKISKAYFINYLEDAFGNRMEFTYSDISDIKAPKYIKSIRYDDVVVDFKYKSIPSTFEYGGVSLHKILQSVGGNNVREYRLKDEGQQFFIKECGYDTYGVDMSCLRTWSAKLTPFQLQDKTKKAVKQLEIVSSHGKATTLDFKHKEFAGISDFQENPFPLENIYKQKIEPDFYYKNTELLEQVLAEIRGKHKKLAGDLSNLDKNTVSNGDWSSINFFPGRFNMYLDQKAPEFTPTKMLPVYGVSEITTDNGLGGKRTIKYAYQRAHRAFSTVSSKYGFTGQLITRTIDDATGVVTYVQRKYPSNLHEGFITHVVKYDGRYNARAKDRGQRLKRTINNYKKETFKHDSGRITHYFYKALNAETNYENDLAFDGHVRTSIPSFENNLLSSSKVVLKNGKVTRSLFGENTVEWGKLFNFDVVHESKHTETNTKYLNRTNGQWLIGFAEEKEKIVTIPGEEQNHKEIKLRNEPHSNSNKVASTTNHLGDPKLELTVKHDYDDFGNQTSTETSGRSIKTHFKEKREFAFNKYPLTEFNEKGHINRVLEIDRRFGQVVMARDPNTRVSKTHRDALGRVTRLISPDEVEKTIQYKFCDWENQCNYAIGAKAVYFVEENSPISPLKRTYYDILGRVVRVETLSNLMSHFSTTVSQYDKAGRIYKKSFPFKKINKEKAHFVEFQYDKKDRIIFTKRPDGGETKEVFKLNPADNYIVRETTTKVFSDKKKIIQTFVNQTHLDLLGQTVKVIANGGSGSLGTETYYTHDPLGNVIKTRIDAGADGEVISNAEYDAGGNLIYLDDPSKGVIVKEYNALRQLTYEKNALNEEIDYEYDVLGRLVKKSDSDGVHEWVWDTAQNGIGALSYRKSEVKRTSFDDAIFNFKESYYYNHNTKLEETKTDISSEIISPFSTTVQFEYDDYGRIEYKIYPENLVVAQKYHKSGFPYKIELNDGTLVKSIMEENHLNKAKKWQYGNGVEQVQNYQLNTGRLSSIYASSSQHGELVDLKYNWLSNGSLQQWTNDIASPVIQRMTYDGFNRLDEIKRFQGGRTYITDYQYDRLGNITNKFTDNFNDTEVINYQYGQFGHGPYALTSATINGDKVNFDYNKAGQMFDYASVNKIITYNAIGQPSGITDYRSQDKTTHWFQYGPDSDRFIKITERKRQVVETTIYAQGMEFILTASDKTMRIPLADDVVAVHQQLRSGGVSLKIDYLHKNHLGSAEAITHQFIYGHRFIHGENDIQLFSFGAFGMRRNEDWMAGELDSNDLSDIDENKRYFARTGFTGHENLDSVNLVHMNGRIYDPVIGRFLTPDPIILQPLNSQSYNRYSYVLNNPMNMNDPSGFEPASAEPEEVVVTGYADLNDGFWESGSDFSFLTIMQSDTDFGAELERVGGELSDEFDWTADNGAVGMALRMYYHLQPFIEQGPGGAFISAERVHDYFMEYGFSKASLNFSASVNFKAYRKLLRKLKKGKKIQKTLNGKSNKQGKERDLPGGFKVTTSLDGSGQLVVSTQPGFVFGNSVSFGVKFKSGVSNEIGERTLKLNFTTPLYGKFGVTYTVTSGKNGISEEWVFGVVSGRSISYTWGKDWASYPMGDVWNSWENVISPPVPQDMNQAGF